MQTEGIFVYFNVVNGLYGGTDHQLECAYARGYLLKHGVKTAQYINRSHDSFCHLLQGLVDFETNVYVFYINEYNYYISSVAINRLKEVHSKTKIWVFGPVSKYLSEHFNNGSNIDCFLVGDPYKTLLKLFTKSEDIGCLLDGSESGNPKVIIGESETPLNELCSIYSNGIVPYEEVGNVGIQTSRGCYGNCLFCSYKNGHSMELLSEEILLEELDYIEYMSNKSAYVIRFLDDCFSGSTERTIRICEQIKNRQYKKHYWCCTRADILNKEVLRKMSECGFRDIVIGLETASPIILQQSGKICNGYDAENYLKKIEDCFRYGEEYGLNPQLSMMIGLPNETESDIRKTVKWITRIGANNRISVCYLTCFPGSSIFDRSEEYNIKKEHSVTGFPFRTFFDKYDVRKIHRLLLNNRIPSLDSIKLVEQTDYYRIRMIEAYSGICDQNTRKRALDAVWLDDCLTKKQIDLIGNQIGSNGLIILPVSRPTIQGKWLFTEDRKRLKYSVKEYDDIIKKFYERNWYVPHVALVGEMNPHKVIVDGVYTDKIIEIGVQEISNSTKLAELVERVNAFGRTWKISVSDIKKGVIKNGCRYTSECTACYNSRVKIGRQEIIACNEKKYKLKKIPDNRKELLSGWQSIREKELLSRECGICSVRNSCAKCVSLPSGIGTDEYCKVMRNTPLINIYVRVLEFAYKFFDMLNTSDGDYVEVISSQADNTLLHGTVLIVFWHRGYILQLETGNYYACNPEEQILVKKLIHVTQNEYGNLVQREKQLLERLRGKGIVRVE